MKFAYADPPYFGYASFYAEHHPDALDYDDIETHRSLLNRLSDEFPDGWALSLTSGNLKSILPLCPDDARVASWVKPFCSFKPNVNPAYAWEPVIFRGGRRYAKAEPTIRDWLAESITLKRGLTGAKPRNFARWIFALLNAQHGDQFDDLFPGTGGIGRAWDEWIGEPMQAGLFEEGVVQSALYKHGVSA